MSTRASDGRFEPAAGGAPVGLYIGYYREQRRGHQLVTSVNELTNEEVEKDWSRTASAQTELDGQAWRTADLRGQAADRLPLGGQMDDLAEVDGGVLRRLELEALARRQEDAAVGGESDALGIMVAAADLRLLPPDDIEPHQARRAVAQFERAIAERGAAGAVHADGRRQAVTACD